MQGGSGCGGGIGSRELSFGGESSEWSSVTNGVSQGSVLFPMLFSICINNIDPVLVSSRSMFADDTILIILTPLTLKQCWPYG